MSASASRSAAGRPRKPCRAGAIRSSVSIMRASAGSTGASRVAVSPRISTKMPPKPTMTSGPNCGSFTMPSSSSIASPPAIAWTSTPSSRACGRARATRASIDSAAAATASGVASPEDHAADVGLVRDVGRHDLDCDRHGRGCARPPRPQPASGPAGPARRRSRPLRAAVRPRASPKVPDVRAPATAADNRARSSRAAGVGDGARRRSRSVTV